MQQVNLGVFILVCDEREQLSALALKDREKTGTDWLFFDDDAE